MFKGYNNTNLIAGVQNKDKPRYVAYHHHTMYSNPTTIDCAISPKSFIQKSLDYGNMTITCCEHGSPLSFYEYHSLLNYRKPKVKDGKPIEPDYRNTAKLVFATEAYFVIDNEVQFEKTYLDDLGNVKSSKTIKDSTNAHIILIAKTEKGRKDINYYGSLANEKGYYYKARWSLDYLLKLDPKDVMITTSCIGGLWKYKTKFNPYKNNLERLSNFENNYNMINQNKTEELKNIAIELAFGGFEKYQEEKEFYEKNKNKIEEWSKKYDYLDLLKILHNHFGDSMYLEIQPHNTDKQKELNILIKELSKALGIKIIVGTDNHLNDEKGNIVRDNFLLSKNISYEDEDGWILSYSDYNTVVKQFLIQGIFTEKEIKEYLDNTLIIETFEEPFISDDIKLPVLPDLRNKSQEEKNKFFVDLIWDKWYNERKPQLKEINKKYFGVEEVIPFQKYEEDIKKEIQVILDTNMADYFLLNYYVIKIGKEKYHGVLTKTGRGCFTPETKVFTTNGYKNIKDVQIGDIIINKNGEFDEVINTLQYDIEEDITEIDSYYNNPVKLTNDHRVYVYDTVKKEFLYKHAKDINSETDRLCLKNINNLNIEDINIEIIDNYIVYKIKSINSIKNYKGKVYDLTIKNDPSFVVEGFIVHNSGGGFYLNNLLGFTSMDRFAEEIPLLSERFISTSRILQSKTLPDIDYRILLHFLGKILGRSLRMINLVNY